MTRSVILALALSAIGCNAGALPPLSIAARRGDLGSMLDLLDEGADPNAAGDGGTRWPPLMHAVHKQQFAAAALLLDRGADPNGAGPNGYTALMMAAAENDPRMVRLLLERGADPRRRGPAGITALSQAITGGALTEIDRPLLGGCHAETVHALLERAPDLALPGGTAGAEARFWAHLHAGLQKMRNLAPSPTTGRAPAMDCASVVRAARSR